MDYNGDNEYTCDDLVAYGDQTCDDNKAQVTLSHTGSSDPDCSQEAGPLCEENDFWWSEAVMGMSYNDLNMNGQWDDGEPCDNGCLWSFDADGIAPAVNDGPESHDNKITEIKLHSSASKYFAKKQANSFEKSIDLASQALKKQILKNK